MKKLVVAMSLLASSAMADTVVSVSSIPDIKVEGKECKPVASVNGVLLWAGSCGSVPVTYPAGGETGKLQNSNPTGLPPSQTSGAPPTSSGGNTRPVTNGNAK
jgi:hypothetical protein